MGWQLRKTKNGLLKRATALALFYQTERRIKVRVIFYGYKSVPRH